MFRLTFVLCLLLTVVSTSLAKKEHGQNSNSHHHYHVNRSRGRGESNIIYTNPKDGDDKIVTVPVEPVNIPNLPCHLSDNECIGQALQNLIRLYSKGNPFIKLPSIEPFYLRKFDMIDNRNKDEGYRIKLTCKNLLYNGFSDFTFSVKGFEEDINTSNVSITMITPKADVHADYDLKLRFKKRNSHGKGRFIWSFDNFKFHVTFEPKVFLNETDNKHYLALHNFNVDYTVTEANLDFGDLFDGDKDASKQEHSFLNANVQEYFENLKYSAAPEWTSIFLHFINPIIETNAIDKVFILDNIKL